MLTGLVSNHIFSGVITYLTVNQPTIAILLDMHDHPGLKSKKINKLQHVIPLI